jgi:hypothetical protein
MDSLCYTFYAGYKRKDQDTGESKDRAHATKGLEPARERGDRVMYRRLRRDTGLSRSLPSTILASFLGPPSAASTHRIPFKMNL